MKLGWDQEIQEIMTCEEMKWSHKLWHLWAFLSRDKYHPDMSRDKHRPDITTAWICPETERQRDRETEKRCERRELKCIGRGWSKDVGERERDWGKGVSTKSVLCWRDKASTHAHTHTADIGNFSGISRSESVWLSTTVLPVYNPETLSSFHQKTTLRLSWRFRDIFTNIIFRRQ